MMILVMTFVGLFGLLGDTPIVTSYSLANVLLEERNEVLFVTV